MHDVLFDGTPKSVADLLGVQWPRPGRGLADTVRALASDDPQHPPLYYALAWLWVQAFGCSITVLRSLSVVLGLLALPSMYWLCVELLAPPAHDRGPVGLDGRRLGTVAVMLLAVSPVHVLYAGEAREYALWTTLTLVSSAALLRAWRRRTGPAWVLYAVSTTLSLYTSPLTGLVVLGHLAYVLWCARPRPPRALLWFGASIGGAGLAFLPWAGAIVEHTTGLSWTAIPIPNPLLAQHWGLHVARAFIVPRGDFGFDTTPVQLTLAAIVPLGAYALYVVARRTPSRIGAFVVLMAGATALPLALPDVLLGGQRSTATRYLLPTILVAQLALALLLARRTRAGARGRLAWRLVTAAILLTGAGSCLHAARGETTWIKVISYHLPSLARIIDEHPRPVIVVSSEGINFGTILALGHRLRPDARLVLVDGRRVAPRAPPLPADARDVFVLDPTADFLAALAQHLDRVDLLPLRHQLLDLGAASGGDDRRRDGARRCLGAADRDDHRGGPHAVGPIPFDRLLVLAQAPVRQRAQVLDRLDDLALRHQLAQRGEALVLGRARGGGGRRRGGGLVLGRPLTMGLEPLDGILGILEPDAGPLAEFLDGHDLLAAAGQRLRLAEVDHRARRGSCHTPRRGSKSGLHPRSHGRQAVLVALAGRARDLGVLELDGLTPRGEQPPGLVEAAGLDVVAHAVGEVEVDARERLGEIRGARELLPVGAHDPADGGGAGITAALVIEEHALRAGDLVDRHHGVEVVGGGGERSRVQGRDLGDVELVGDVEDPQPGLHVRGAVGGGGGAIVGQGHRAAPGGRIVPGRGVDAKGQVEALHAVSAILGRQPAGLDLAAEPRAGGVVLERGAGVRDGGHHLVAVEIVDHVEHRPRGGGAGQQDRVVRAGVDHHAGVVAEVGQGEGLPLPVQGAIARVSHHRALAGAKAQQDRLPPAHHGDVVVRDVERLVAQVGVDAGPVAALVERRLLHAAQRGEPVVAGDEIGAGGRRDHALAHVSGGAGEEGDVLEPRAAVGRRGRVADHVDVGRREGGLSERPLVVRIGGRVVAGRRLVVQRGLDRGEVGGALQKPVDRPLGRRLVGVDAGGPRVGPAHQRGGLTHHARGRESVAPTLHTRSAGRALAGALSAVGGVAGQVDAIGAAQDEPGPARTDARVVEARLVRGTVGVDLALRGRPEGWRSRARERVVAGGGPGRRGGCQRGARRLEVLAAPGRPLRQQQGERGCITARRSRSTSHSHAPCHVSRGESDLDPRKVCLRAAQPGPRDDPT
ncbi:MAG: glycosyltransferase family 39 protein [Myxococcales bacterium]|nr:glycosyltransferase family 39 protein [Myxococcales bacterium]